MGIEKTGGERPRAQESVGEDQYSSNLRELAMLIPHVMSEAFMEDGKSEPTEEESPMKKRKKKRQTA